MAKKKQKKKYFVCMRVSGRFGVWVDAVDANDALEAATAAYEESDFGELEDIDAVGRYIEDEDGRRVWEDLDAMPDF